MKSEIGYKVVSKDYLESFYLDGVKEAFVQYKKDEWVSPQPGNGPLAVWMTLEKALTSIAKVLKHCSEIWECEYIPSQEKGTWYWHKDGYMVVDNLIADQSALASNVKLLRRIE
jgi:hypothetical protein